MSDLVALILLGVFLAACIACLVGAFLTDDDTLGIWLLTGCFVFGLCMVGVGIFMAIQQSSDFAQACHAKGGSVVSVEGGDGYVCVETGKVIVP